MSHLYFINGVFFQDHSWLDLGYQHGMGESVVICRDLCRFTYAGVIYDDREGSGATNGSMQDYFGQSVLSNVIITPNELKFTKQYEGRDHSITYTFWVKDGETWVGEYEGSRVGKGISRCILIPIEEAFFQPELALKALGRDVAYAASKGQ